MRCPSCGELWFDGDEEYSLEECERCQGEDEEVIDSFSGQYRWLSNFWPVEVKLDGARYASVEHAYQAAKCAYMRDRVPFQYGVSGQNITAGQAKKLGRKVTMREDWEDVKVDFMVYLLRQKFAPGSDLAQRLLDTGQRDLVEGNTWGDTFWGVCNGEGENMLGKLLMLIREELR